MNNIFGLYQGSQRGRERKGSDQTSTLTLCILHSLVIMQRVGWNAPRFSFPIPLLVVVQALQVFALRSLLSW
jgi:hypothetical protein